MPLREELRFHKLSSNEDVFHHFQWPNVISIDTQGPSNQGGRPRYPWTLRQSRELVNLIIHTDLTFEDIAVALKDENGRGPCKATCRKRWHEIFGYDPSVARLLDAERQSYRKNCQIRAFHEFNGLQSQTSSNSVLGPFMPFPTQNTSESTTTGTGASSVGDDITNIEYKEGYPPGFISWIKLTGSQDDQLAAHPQSNPEPGQYEYLGSRSIAGIGQTSICEMLQTLSATDSSLPLLMAPVEILLREGANVNEANSRGETPLHLAVGIGHIPIITLLLEYGADPHRASNAGESIWQFGRKASHGLVASAHGLDDGPDVLERIQAYCRIEFAQSTMEFNPSLVIKGRSRRQDRSSPSSSEHTFQSVPRPEQPWLHQGMPNYQLMVAPASPPAQFGDTPNQFENLWFLPGSIPRSLEEELLELDQAGEWY